MTDRISRNAHLDLENERQENRQKRMAGLLNRSAIPTRYADAKLVIKSESQAEAYRAGELFVDHFETHLKTGKGMVIWGDVGTGKTHLSCAIANALMANFRPVLYCTALEAVLRVKSTWNKREQSEFDIYAQFGDPDLLIIDEIGVQIGSEFERMVLTAIADIRSRNCRPTIIISNLNPSAIFELLGERMFDRLVGFGASVVHMAGPSLRAA